MIAAAENALYAEQAKNQINTRPSRTKAKYGAVNGVYAPFFFSAVKLKVLHIALFKRLYEDNVLGRINNEQFRMLSCGYTDEQKSIDAKLPKLEKQIQNLQQAASDVDKFIGLAKKYTRITELTPEILHTLVSKIVIHERRERFKQNTEQQIDIYFRYIGNTAGL